MDGQLHVLGLKQIEGLRSEYEAIASHFTLKFSDFFMPLTSYYSCSIQEHPTW